MSVLKNLTIRFDSLPETDVWVAILKTSVSLNSLNAIYDGFYYKNEIIVISCTDGNQLRLQLRGKHVILKFGSLFKLIVSVN
ncbi:hypothetical protein MTP99_006980 [Tenebrio molitor]|nr:hypothetical protein MTP99_006980 [Tenebrio molitor]